MERKMMITETRFVKTRVALVGVAVALAAGLLTLAVVLAKSAQAQADTFTDTYQDTFRFYTGGCTGEPVLIEGTLHTVAHTTIDANGGYHTKFQYNLKGQGEGLDSGDKYLYNDTFGYNVNSTGAINQTQTETFKITSQGSGSATDDLQGKVLYHVTVNANGEVTTEVYNFEFECT
jgi:hypothetical protein